MRSGGRRSARPARPTRPCCRRRSRSHLVSWPAAICGPLDHEDSAIGRWAGTEGSARDRGPGAEAMTVRSRSIDPTARGAALEQQVGADQAAGGMEQALQERIRDRPRRVGDDVERAAREAEVRGIDLRHPDVRPEALTKGRGPTRVQLDRDDPRPALEQRCGEGTVTRADVEHQVTLADAGVGDESLSPRGVESVPAPGRRTSPGHEGAPPASPSACGRSLRATTLGASEFAV